MTAIILNLLAEEQLAEQAQARDPVKTAIAISTTLLMLAVLSGSLLWVAAGQNKTEAALLQGRWDVLVTAQSIHGGGDFKAMRSHADDLVSLNRSRALFARQMALIKDLVPDSIQISRISLALNTEVRDAGAGGGDAGESAGKDKAAKAARPKNVERLSLQLEGGAIGGRPELEVDKFLQTLRSSPDFSTQVEQIQLRSIARSTVTSSPAGPSVPSVNFVIGCQYKEQQ